jgi:P27 family predicted phage terminase small subunit
MRGRKPKPSSVHEANGNPGKRSRTRREPKAPRGIPAPFSHLSDDVKNAWLEIGRVLNLTRVITHAHGHALEQMAEELVEIREHRRELKKNRSRYQTIRTTNGSKKQIMHPAQFALSDAEKRFRVMLEEFGMTPSAATRVTAQPTEKPDPATAEFFGDDDDDTQSTELMQ